MSDQLTAIDDALETGAADHHDPLTRELQELALALRADAPEPDDEFRHELGRRVRSGFPKPVTLRKPLWRRAVTRLRDRTRCPADRIDRSARRRVAEFGRSVVERGRRRRRRRWRGRTGDRRGGARAGASGVQAGGRQAAGSNARAVPIPPDGGFAPGQRNRKIERSIGSSSRCRWTRWLAWPSR